MSAISLFTGGSAVLCCILAASILMQPARATTSSMAASDAECSDFSVFIVAVVRCYLVIISLMITIAMAEQKRQILW